MSTDIQNSWYMSKPLSECKNLFSKEEVSEYQAHFYHCECGHNEVALSSNGETPLYQCEQCDNTCFINIDVKKGYLTLHYTNLNFIYECKKVDDGYIVNTYLNIPYHADFLRNKLLYKKEFIASLTVSFSKRSHIFKLPRKNFRAIDILKRKTKDFIIKDTGDELIYYKDSLNKIEEIHPFSFNPNLIDTEFSFWKKIDLRILNNPKSRIGVIEMLHYLLNYRKERSLKRVLFEKYKQLQDDGPSFGFFDPLGPFVVSRCFNDPNIASKLLKNDCMISEPLEEGRYSLHDMIWFLMFLKKHYREKQIAKMLLDFKNEWHIWSDIIFLVPNNKRILKRKFNKVKLTIENLHNEIIRCTIEAQRKPLVKLKFSYEENYKQACTKMVDLEFRLPSTNEELWYWAECLHNCISGYYDAIEKRRTTIYGAFRDHKILYAIEVTSLEINEMSGKYNNVIPIEDKNIINKWWEKYLYQ